MDRSPSGLVQEHDRLMRGLLQRGAHDPSIDGALRIDAPFDEPAVDLAARAWRRRMEHEHRSAAVFSAMLPQAMAAGAWIDTKTLLMRAAMDELHHASLCAQVVRYLGARARVETELSVKPLPAHEERGPVVCFLRNLIFASCLSETVSMALLTQERERCADVQIAGVLRQLASDESLHARLGWLTLASWMPELGAAQIEALLEYMPVALGHLEAEMLQAMPLGAALEASIEERAMRLGFTPAADARALFYATVDEVILPQLEQLGLRGIAASWSRRTGGAVEPGAGGRCVDGS